MVIVTIAPGCLSLCLSENIPGRWGGGWAIEGFEVVQLGWPLNYVKFSQASRGLTSHWLSAWAEDDLSFLSVFLDLSRAVEMSKTRCVTGVVKVVIWDGEENKTMTKNPHNDNKTQHNDNKTQYNDNNTKQSKTKQKYLKMDRSNFPESGSMFFLVMNLTVSLARLAIHQMLAVVQVPHYSQCHMSHGDQWWLLYTVFVWAGLICALIRT